MDLRVDHRSPLPLYAQVEGLLRTLVDDDRYRNGELLPNEQQLAKRLGISRGTVRAGIDKLVTQGLLERRRGIGTRVVNHRVNVRLAEWPSFTREMEARGVRVKTHDTQIGWIPADEDVSRQLAIAPGTRVLRVERVRGWDGDRVVLFVSHFHPRIGLSGQEDFTRPTYEMLEQDFATVAAASDEEITAVAADRSLAVRLAVPRGTPLLVRRQRVLDPGDRPIVLTHCYYRADKFTYSIRLRKD
jgi:GntR family transcriptional regulator